MFKLTTFVSFSFLIAGIFSDSIKLISEAENWFLKADQVYLNGKINYADGIAVADDHFMSDSSFMYSIKFSFT